MSNSSLVNCTVKSPNHSGARTHSIDRITPHCVVGQLSAESIGACFTSPSREASCNYGIGTDGRVVLCVDEVNRSWCSSSNANDQRAVTIECASDKTHPYAMTNAVYEKLVALCVDICRRNGKTKLVWFGDKDKSLNYSPKSNEMLLTIHRWFTNKSCPGDWLYNRLGDLASAVTEKLTGSDSSGTSGLRASALKDMGEADIIKKVGGLFTADQKSSGIPASVSLAQFILESGYGKSELAQNANNCFGMKCSLSGNTWGGSSWDGASKYVKKTQEYENGRYVTVTADFRKYSNVEQSIADHSAYLLGAMNGARKRYDGLKGCTDYRKAIGIIKDGGYATSPDYVEKICKIIEGWNLTAYDDVESTDSAIDTFPDVPFTVKVLISDLNYRSKPSMSGKVKGQTGKGVFTVVEVKDGWGRLKSGAGWIYLLNRFYCTVNGSVSSGNTRSYIPYTVRVDISDLYIRKGPGTDCGNNGFCPKGIYTIVEVKSGAGSDAGWGKLKSGAGWISLDYATRI